MKSKVIQELKQSIKATKSKIQRKIRSYSNMTKVIIIGITGGGKSSLTCCLANEEVTISQGAGRKVILKGPGITSGTTSGTTEPSIIVDYESNIIYCDCPGFEDTRGYKQEIINSFIIDYLFKKTTRRYNNKFKILLVISASEFDAFRAKGVSDSIERMTQMFPNPEQLEKAIGLVITKTEPELTGKDYIEMLEDNSPENMENWINFFKSNPNRVFIFPMASRLRIGQKYDFDDHQKLIRFLQTNQITNPVHRIVLSESATLYVKNLRINANNNIQNNVNGIFSLVADDYKGITSSYDLQDWIDVMNELKDSDTNNSYQLSLFFKDYLPNYDQYTDYFSDLTENEEIYSFTDEILNEKNSFSKLNQYVNSSVDDVIEELQELYNQAEEEEERERLRIEYEEELRRKRRRAARAKRKREELQRLIEQQKQEEEEQRRKEEELKRIQRQNQIEINNLRIHSSDGWFCIIA